MYSSYSWKVSGRVLFVFMDEIPWFTLQGLMESFPRFASFSQISPHALISLIPGGKSNLE
jgi:hypothetical protein